jgi:protein gp37
MAQSSIEWTEMTWNPTTGCNKLTAGCKFCYAEVMSRRLHAMGIEKYKNNFKITLHPRSLSIPYTWKKPKIVFVNSMSDLFHKEVPLEYVQRVFKVMNETPQHTYQVLTKRGDLLMKYDKSLTWTPNIWMGVSIEDTRVIERIDYLRKCNAQVKFLSLEPLLSALPKLNLKSIDWVIVGGESGPKSRPMEKEWVIDIKKQCKKANVSFFFKQWGGVRKSETGRMLNGRTYDEMPALKSVTSKAYLSSPTLV